MSAARLAAVVQMMRDEGADTVLLKRLAANDNSKNQVYLGGSEAALRELRVDLGSGFRSSSAFRIDHTIRWIDDAGLSVLAPHAKVIFYPQYPEVRLSGFAKGVAGGFGGRDLLVKRDYGRTLLVGLTGFGWLLWVGKVPEREFKGLTLRRLRGTPFEEVRADATSPDEIWNDLLTRIRDLAAGPPLPSVKLLSAGTLEPTNPRDPHSSGYALEAALGIPVNASAGPDYRGLVELKTFSGSRISLMTPEPTGGVYAGGVAGKRDFLQRWGSQGRDGRRRFNGQHRLNEPKTTNPLTLRVAGWLDREPGRYQLDAALSLRDAAGVEAASWLLKDMNAKWQEKHDQALYVQYERAGDRFRLTGKAFVCRGTDFRLFMLALRAGAVAFDPGHSMDVDSGRLYARSQWRTNKNALLALYDEVQDLDLLL